MTSITINCCGVQSPDTPGATGAAGPTGATGATGATGSTGPGGGGFSTITVPLSSVQLQALNASPILAVAAPGAGKVIQVIDVLWSYVFNTVFYTGVSQMGLFYTDFSGQPAGDNNAVRAAFANNFSQLAFGAGLSGTFAATPSFDNKTLVVTGDADWGGGGDGTGEVQIIYRVVTL